MKKYLLITISAIVLLTLLAGTTHFFAAKNREPNNAPKNSPSELPAPIALQSFRGALAGIPAKSETKTGEVIAEITNPFSEKKPLKENPPAQTSYADEFSFAIIGDTQSFDTENPNGYFQKSMAQIANLNPDMVVALGDLVSSCDGDSKCAKKYADWKKIIGSFLDKTYAVQGNHDRTGDNKADNIWQSSFNFPTNGPPGFSEQVYSLDLKNSHFVFLDSDKPKEHLVNDEERSWLENNLAVNKKENTFVFFHEPAYPVSSKIAESLDVEPSERDALWQILEKYNVTAVFSGHEHIVSRRKVGKIYQFVFGSTDSFNHDLPNRGVAEYTNQGQGRFGIVKVKGKEITIKTFSSDNTELNSFTFSK